MRGGIGKIPFPTQQRHVYIQVTWWHGWHPGASDQVPESQKLNYGAITKRDFAHFCNIEEKKSSILVKTEQLFFHHVDSLTQPCLGGTAGAQTPSFLPPSEQHALLV